MDDIRGKSWGEEEDFCHRYLAQRDVIVPSIERLEGVLYEFFKEMVKEDSPCVCELGCGDGVTMEGLLKINPDIRGLAVDGSLHMLKEARKRLSAYSGIDYLESDFLRLKHIGLGKDNFHLIYSVLSLHHLGREDKVELLGQIERALVRGGYFVNIDIVVPASKEIEEWYEKLYRRDIDEASRKRGIESPAEEVLRRAAMPEHRQRLLTLEEELGALKEAGLRDVECYYKELGFVVYGGKKP